MWNSHTEADTGQPTQARESKARTRAEQKRLVKVRRQRVHVRKGKRNSTARMCADWERNANAERRGRAQKYGADACRPWPARKSTAADASTASRARKSMARTRAGHGKRAKVRRGRVQAMASVKKHRANACRSRRSSKSTAQTRTGHGQRAKVRRGRGQAAAGLRA